MAFTSRPPNTGNDRIDGENPNTHCFGWTQKNLACRRTIAQAKRNDPTLGRAGAYCFQHRHQAISEERLPPRHTPQATPRYAPQATLRHAPEATPQYVPPYTPQYVPPYTPRHAPQATPRYVPPSPQSSRDSSPAPSVFSAPNSPFSSPETSPDPTPDPTPSKSYIGRKPSAQEASSSKESDQQTPSKSFVRGRSSAQEASLLSSAEELSVSTPSKPFIRRNLSFEMASPVSSEEESPSPTPSKSHPRRELSSRSESIFSLTHSPEASPYPAYTKPNTTKKHSNRPGINPFMGQTVMPSPLRSPVNELPASRSPQKKSHRIKVKLPTKDVYVDPVSLSPPIVSPPITFPPMTAPPMTSPASSSPRQKPSPDYLPSQSRKNYEITAPRSRASFLSIFTCCFPSRKPQNHKNKYLDHDRPETNHRLPLNRDTFPAQSRTASPVSVSQRDESFAGRSNNNAPRTDYLSPESNRKNLGKILTPIETPVLAPSEITKHIDSPVTKIDVFNVGPDPTSFTVPEVASKFILELSKQISPTDEQGYIYMFWLNNLPPDQIPAISPFNLLTSFKRQTNRVIEGLITLHENGEVSGALNKRLSKILIKIGRTNSLERRAKELKNSKCGYNFTEIRTYPNISAVPSSSQRTARSESAPPGQSQHRLMVPYVKKVERLIHLELGEIQAKKITCSCGTQHQEIFEVDNSPEAMRKVDQVIMKWVRWAIQQHGRLH